MKFSVLSGTFLFLAFLCQPGLAADEFLSINFSKKNQLRTAMTWIQFKSHLILAPGLGDKPSRSSRKQQIRKVTAQQTIADPPFSSVGKLFYTKDYGQVANCSASLIEKSGIIATSAHCVMALSGDWNADFIFVRAYGTEEQDIFAIDCIGLPDRWGESSEESILHIDYAFLKSSRLFPDGGLTINTTTTVPPQLRIVGYSDEFFDGRNMLDVDATVLEESQRLGAKSLALGKGNSGSPWVDADGKNLYSLSSNYNKYEKTVMWGPRLNQDTIRLLQYVDRGCRY